MSAQIRYRYDVALTRLATLRFIRSHRRWPLAMAICGLTAALFARQGLWLAAAAFVLLGAPVLSSLIRYQWQAAQLAQRYSILPTAAMTPAFREIVLTQMRAPGAVVR